MLDNKNRKAVDSLGTRFTSKLRSRLTGFALGLATVGIVPRSLGPGLYGDYNFLTFFFARVVKFLNFGTSTAFYIKLSERPEERKLIGFYLYYFALLASALVFGIGGIFLFDFSELVWPEQEMTVVLAAALLGILNFGSTQVHQVCDAYGFTVRNEMFFVLQSVLSVALLLGLYFSGFLTLTTYFAMQYALLLFVIIAGWRILGSNGIHPFSNLRLAAYEVRGYAREFFDYSHPLFVYSLTVLFVGIGDRWMLQHFAGSQEQGFYSLAFKVGAIVFMFTSSMSSLFTREMSVSHGKGDTERMRDLFRIFIPPFYFVAAYFACFVAVEADVVAGLIGGDEYARASVVIAVMAFYPVHQTYGQLSGSVFLATGQTRLFRNINMSVAVPGIVASLVLMGPPGSWGQDLGATGLGVKMLAVQFLTTNVQLWYNSKYLNLVFRDYFFHQLVVLTLLSGLAYLSRSLVASYSSNILLSFFLSGVVYTVLVALTLLVFPRLLAMRRAELVAHLASIRRKLVGGATG